MANITAKTSIYYDAQWGIRVLRETFDGTNTASDTVVNQPCLPNGVQANLYEMRYVPQSGATGNITRNDASDWVAMGLVRTLEHTTTVTPAAADGTYNSTVAVQVDVRKISNPIDAVSGVITLTNSIVKTTNEGGATNPYYYRAEYLGADADTGSCSVIMEIRAATPHQLRIYAVTNGPSTGNQNNIFQLGVVDWTTAGITLNQYRITTTFVSEVIGGGTNIGNYTLNYTAGGTAAVGIIASSNLGKNGTGSHTLTYRINITRISDNVVMYDKYYRLNANTRN